MADRPSDQLLLRAARLSLLQIHAQLEIVERPAVLREAFHAFAAQRPVAAGGGYYRGGAIPAESEPEERQWEVEIWAMGEKIREERRSNDLESLVVIHGHKWWSWSSLEGYSSSGAAPEVDRLETGLSHLDPSRLLDGNELHPRSGSVAIAGRPTRRFDLLSQGTLVSRGLLHPGIVRAELLLDAEHGVILRSAQVFNGKPAAVTEVGSIEYDFRPGAELFVMDFGRHPKTSLFQPQIMQIGDLSTQASFAPFIPTTLPDVWVVEASLVPAVSQMPETVSLSYRTSDGTRMLDVKQQRARFDLPASGRADRLTLDGRTFVVLGPEQPIGQEPAEVIFKLDDTYVRISSARLNRGELLEIAVQRR